MTNKKILLLSLFCLILRLETIINQINKTMKKSLLIIVALFWIGIAAKAQILFTDNFDSYTTGGFMVQQAQATSAAWWTTWNNQLNGGAEDAKITEAQAHSPLKSVIVDNAADDIILKLGNKTSGKYSIAFNYFIPTGFGGYFNIQHYQAPGIQWACEVYFGSNGTGYILAEGDSTSYTHPLDAWIDVETIVDINLDSAWYYINGLEIAKWKFSTKTDGTAGAAQLGGVDFYGGSITGQLPKYYFDDVVFTQLAQPLDPPTINVSTASINTSGLAPESFTISNTGEENMTYVAYPTYPYSANNVPAATSPTEMTYIQSAFASGLGGFVNPVTVRAAAKFTPAKISPSIGQNIASVLVTINTVPTNTSLLIYERGSYITPGPGTLLASKPFTATTDGETVEITLDSPIYVDGNDLWIGYTCDAAATTYPLGLDGGPRIAGVNWIATGPGWAEYNNTVDANLMVAATVTGSAIKQWLTVTPASGALTPTQSQTMNLAFNITGLTDGNYLSTVVIGSNDPANEYSEVDVNLTVVTSIDNNNNSIGIMTYPNPANHNFNIKSDTNIDLVTLYDINGKLINTYKVNSTSTQIDVNNLSKGNYLMKIKTGSNEVTRNVVVE